MQVTRGKVPSAQKVLVYGPEGIGKSTFAAQFPEALFIDIEGSTKHMDVARVDTPSSWTMLMQQVAWVLKTRPCKTLVIDTADWAEALCIAHVCAKAQKGGIEDFGYGKGYTYLAEEFGNLLNMLTEVIGAGIHVVLTAHATIRKFEQPDEAGAYDRYELKLGKKTAPLVKEWADAVLFVNYKTLVVKDSATGKARGNGGKRTLYTSHTPTWDAKNRHGLDPEMPFEFGAIATALLGPEGGKLPEPVSDTVQPNSAKIADPAPAPETPEPTALPTTEVPAHLRALFDLMSAAGVTEVDIRQVVASKGYFPVATPIEKYPADFVEGVLVGAWDQVLSVIKSNEPF